MLQGGEFSVIEKYFSSQALQRQSRHTVLGIGDDAAIIDIPSGQQLVVTMDTLVAGRHYPVNTPPQDIAYKSLAVNVSDLVAMAARPAYFLLSLTMPDSDEQFLQSFSEGLFNAADDFGVSLVGGDTCKGPLSITIQANGLIDKGQFVTRSNAKQGDKIVVSGKLGAAALGLANIQNQIEISEQHENVCLHALNRPSPRLDLIDMLRQFASAAIDISDGLLGDLRHILNASSVGAVINKQQIPAHQVLREQNLFDLALTGGDDYQILFTVAEKNLDALLNLAKQEKIELFVIGDIVEQGYFMMDQNKSIDVSTFRGFDHFVS